MHVLRPHTLLEPLFNRWYAIPHLTAPATASLTAVRKLLPILKSFVAAPAAHAAALKNPAFVGGPFLDFDASRVPEVQALIDRLQGDGAPLLELERGIAALDKLLAQETKGEGLEHLYETLPECLRGRVELTYDRYHRPSFRLLERPLYRSRHYVEALQGVMLAQPEPKRAFAVMPRLSGPGRLFLDLSLTHPAARRLFDMKYTPAPLGELVELLGPAAPPPGALEPYFAEPAPPPPGRDFEGDGLRVRYFGHACVLVQTREVNVLLDPGISYAFSGGQPRFTFEDLPDRIDYALVTHAHPDHCSLEVLLQLRNRIRQLVVPRAAGGSLVDPSLRLMLERLGFTQVVEAEELEGFPLPGGQITALPFLGEHCDLEIRSKTTYLVELAGKALLFLSDTSVPESRVYDHLLPQGRKLDALFMGMESEGAPMSWGYGALFPEPIPRRMDQPRRTNSVNEQRALALVGKLTPQRVCIYSMGFEPWVQHVMGMEYRPDSPQLVASDKVLAYCKQQGIEGLRPLGQLELLLA